MSGTVHDRRKLPMEDIQKTMPALLIIPSFMIQCPERSYHHDITSSLHGQSLSGKRNAMEVKLPLSHNRESDWLDFDLRLHETENCLGLPSCMAISILYASLCINCL